MASEDEYIGSVSDYAAVRGPMKNHVLCDGSHLPIAQYQALYSLIGAAYGGDGSSWFAVPDLRPTDEHGTKRPWRSNEIKKIICTQGIYPPFD